MTGPFMRTYETKAYKARMKNKLPIAYPSTIRAALAANFREAGVESKHLYLYAIGSEQYKTLKTTENEKIRLELLVKLEESVAVYSSRK